MTYYLVAYTQAIQFKDIIVEHFNLHQFVVVTRDGCEIVIHGIRTILDFAPILGGAIGGYM